MLKTAVKVCCCTLRGQGILSLKKPLKLAISSADHTASDKAAQICSRPDIDYRVVKQLLIVGWTCIMTGSGKDVGRGAVELSKFWERVLVVLPSISNFNSDLLLQLET